ncbi:MAG: hypothetical protein ABI867_22795 [Kofleriaceae bacterium]
MRTFLIVSGLGSIFGMSVLALTASAAEPKPTTQACLGDFNTFLTCPAGSKRWGTECRADEQHGGKGSDEHWSGSKRQGPSIFLRDDDETDPKKQRVSFAANYKDHKKHGRVFRFDKDGVFESFSDMANDDYNGLSVDCFSDGKVSNLAYFKNGKVVGIALHWKQDGSFSFAYDQGKRESVSVPASQMTRPDHLCRPAKCDVTTPADLSGVPK